MGPPGAGPLMLGALVMVFVLVVALPVAYLIGAAVLAAVLGTVLDRAGASGPVDADAHRHQ